MRSRLGVVLAIGLGALAGGCGGNEKPVVRRPPPPAPPPEPPGPPVAARRSVKDVYQGVSVDDPYRWLEGDDAEVTAWVAGQTTYARRILDAAPARAAIHDEIAAVILAPGVGYYAVRAVGGALFALRAAPDKEQPELVVMTDPAHPEDATLVVDPAADGDATRTIDWYVPSPDGTKIAVSISTGGSEAGALHLVDRSGAALEEPIPNVQRGTGGGSAAWTADGRGIYYTRYPAPGEPHADEPDRWMHVWFHRLGAPRSDDVDELGAELPPIAEIRVTTGGKDRVLATVQNGDGGEFRHYLRAPRGGWLQVDDWADAIVAATFAPNGDLLLVSRKDAPRGKVLRLPRGSTRVAKARPLIPEGKDTIFTEFEDDVGVVATADRLYVLYQVGGPSELRAFTPAGKPGPALALPPVASVGKPVPWRGGILVRASTFVTAPTWYAVAGKTGAAAPIAALSPEVPLDLSGYEVRREAATSKDGTAVPLSILWPVGAPRDGTTPCVATGYGGFGISLEPELPRAFAPLFSRRVCYAVVNLRGGGELGEDWHRAGMREHKQNVFDDFAAALAYLIEQDYTRRDHLGIIGGSNGGLLMGAMLTQHPELARVVVSEVGIYDMLRNELTRNGLYNVPEYGTVTDPAQFAALYAYSPYHHVAMGTRFPSILFTTGANDPRVEPWHSRKMLAALQHAAAGDHPIILRVSSTSGHGIGTSTSEIVEELTDVLAFLLGELGR